MKMKVTIIALFLMIGVRHVGASDSIATIAVYKIKSKVLSSPFTEVLTEHIESTLLTYRFFRVISRSNLDVIITEDHLVQSGVTSEDRSLQSNISAVEKVCTGSVGRAGKKYSFTLKMIDVRTGRIEAAVQRIHDGPEEGLLGIASEMMEQLCRRPQPPKPQDTAMVKHDAIPQIEMKISSSDKTLSTQDSEKEVKKTGECIDQPFKQASVSTGVAQPAGLKREKTVNDRKPSNLGKLISIGAAVIFVALATVLLVNRN